jgi:hypothetical protein
MIMLLIKKFHAVSILPQHTKNLPTSFFTRQTLYPPALRLFLRSHLWVFCHFSYHFMYLLCGKNEGLRQVWHVSKTCHAYG